MDKRQSYIWAYGILALTLLALIAFFIWSGSYPSGTDNSSTSTTTTQTNTGGLDQTYTSSTKGFTIKYPAGYTVDENYQYTALGPGKEISGVKFTIPTALTAGTNLSSDSYISVEVYSPNSALKTCQPSYFLDGATKSQEMNDGSMTYLVESTTGAAAGNRYEETIYAFPGGSKCMAVRYFIHYGVIDNYPTGTVKEFDKAALLSQFDAIRRTLVIGQ